MKLGEVSGKSVLITGAASGMGRCLSLDLAKEGAKLILVDICGDALGNVAKEVEGLGGEAHTFCVDITSWEQVKRLAQTIHSRWGAVDVLVNCAGIAHMCHVVDTPLEDWECLLGVNIWGIIHMVKAFAPKMMKKKSGQIVNFSSGQAFFAVPTWGPYACTKYAVDGYSEALRYELYWHGIGVTTVYPGVVRTPFYACITGGTIVKLGFKLLMAIAAKPETISKMVVRAIKKNKKYVISPEMWPIYLLKRLIPWPFELAGRAIAWGLRKEKGISIAKEKET